VAGLGRLLPARWKGRQCAESAGPIHRVVAASAVHSHIPSWSISASDLKSSSSISQCLRLHILAAPSPYAESLISVLQHRIMRLPQYSWPWRNKFCFTLAIRVPELELLVGGATLEPGKKASMGRTERSSAFTIWPFRLPKTFRTFQQLNSFQSFKKDKRKKLFTYGHRG
jgi:hypothetical protein